MPIETLPTENHGEMDFTGRFDPEGRAIFECAKCGASIALGGPAERTYKRIAQGNFYARHQAYTTLEVYLAALEQEVWPQASGNRELIEAWKRDGGGPLFTIGDVKLSSRSSDDAQPA